jgi:hypothetical protein
MENLRWKIRIMLLWIISAEAYSAHMIMVTIDPVSMKKMLDWGAMINAEGWLFGTIYWLIPFCMAFVTITAKDKANRRANLIMSIINTIFNIYHFFMCGMPLINPVLFSKPTIHHILLLGSAVVATILIIWYSWKWPKQQA